jgi:hypothetical protein
VPLRHCPVEDLIAELAPATPLLLLIPKDYFSYDDFEEWAVAQMTKYPLFSPPLPMKLAPAPIQFDSYTVPLCHCHVKDLIELAPATPILLLIPEDYSSYDDLEEWEGAQMTTRHKVHINGQFYLQLDASAYLNPKWNTIQPLMHQTLEAFICELYEQDKGLNVSITR